MRSFEHSLPMQLLKARESVMKRIIPYLRAHQLTPHQWRVLRALYETQGLELSEVSRRYYLLMPSLSRIVQNLEKRMLISRCTSDSDQRRSIVLLSEWVDKLESQQ